MSDRAVVEETMDDNKQLSALKTVWLGIEDVDRGVMAFLEADGSAELAIAAMRHPMKGLQGQVEGMIFNISPDALDQLQETASVSQDDAIMRAYAAYDSDPRVHGPDDFEAFSDAVRSLLDAQR